MPRRMHAVAAALSNRRRFARCSSLKSCSSPGKISAQRLSKYCSRHCGPSTAHVAQMHGKGACQRSQAPKLVLLQLLPGVIIFILPLERLHVGHLLCLITTASGHDMHEHTGTAVVVPARGSVSWGHVSLLEVLIILPCPKRLGCPCCCWHGEVICLKQPRLERLLSSLKQRRRSLHLINRGIWLPLHRNVPSLCRAPFYCIETSYTWSNISSRRTHAARYLHTAD